MPVSGSFPRHRRQPPREGTPHAIAWSGLRRRTPHDRDPCARRQVSPAGQSPSGIRQCLVAVERFAAGHARVPATGRRRERRQPQPGAEDRSGSPPSGSTRADRKAATTVDRLDTQAEIRQTRMSMTQTARTASVVGTGSTPEQPADHLITSGGSGEASRIRDVKTARAQAPRDAERSRRIQS